MKIDFFPASSWERANALAKEEMKKTVTDSEFEVRCFRGLAVGLLETFYATASFLSHKKTLGIVIGDSWVQEALLPHLLRENFQIKRFTRDDLQNPDHIINELGAEGSCLFWPEDHPVTGEVFDGTKLEEALTKKRIFSIRVSHFSFRTRPLKLQPYTVRLCSIHSELSVAVLGARYKTPAWISPWENWEAERVQTDLQTCFKDTSENQQQVLGFEKSLGKGWQPFLKTEDRLWDRALIYNSTVSGDRALHDLKQVSGLETTHLCRWEATLKHFEWWTRRPEADILRGLVILDVRQLESPLIQGYFRG